jgi:hypothetical protein
LDCGYPAILHDLPSHQILDHLGRERFGILFAGRKAQFGVFGRLVGLVDAGEILDFAGQCAAVQAFRIARDA